MKSNHRDTEAQRSTLRTSRLEWLAVGLLLALFALRAGHTAWTTSPTFDEPLYIFCGYSYFIEGRFDRTCEHPPLARELTAAPLLLLHPKFMPGAAANGSPALQRRELEPGFPEYQFIFTHNRDRAQLIVFVARLASILVALGAALVVHRWARVLYGPPAGLLALLLFTFDPNVLAHAANASGDMILATAMLAGCFAWWSFLRRESWPRLIAAGLLLGAAIATRFVGVLAAGMFAMVWIAERAGRRADTDREVLGRSTWRIVPQAIIVLLLALFVFFCAYAFETGRPTDQIMWPKILEAAGGRNPLGHWAEATLPLPNVVLGLYFQKAHMATGHAAFLMGQVSRHGWWYYFPVAFVIKTPIALMLLLALALAITVIVSFRESMRRELALLLPVGLYGAFCLSSSIDIGYRFLLPALLLLFVFAGKVMEPGLWRARWLRLVPVVLCVWLGVSSLLIHPHYLAYFNETIGGPKHGYKYLVDSSLDWGQALPALKEWMVEHKVDEVNLSYFGTADPAYYGIRYQFLQGFNFLRPEIVYDPQRRPPAEYFAISATSLQGPYFTDPDAYKFFRTLEPGGEAGYAILIYRLPRARNAAETRGD